jgi:hypothetical protein
MRRRVRGTVVASSLALALIAAGAASAQKSGGILKVSHFDSPASMSPLEEATIAALRPTMGVYFIGRTSWTPASAGDITSRKGGSVAR